MERNYKQETREIFESVANNGIKGAIPTLIIESLCEAEIGGGKAEILKCLSEGCKKMADKMEISEAQSLLDGRDIYEVYKEVNGQKRVKIHGYFSFEEGITFTNICHCILTLPIDTGGLLYYESGFPQYVAEYTDKEFLEAYQRTFSRYPKLDLGKVYENTPCGMYIDF
jgi:hypothetical protein